MRSKREIEQFIQSLGITKDQCTGIGLDEALEEYADPNRLGEFGLVSGVGVAFIYQRKGVVVLTHQGVGQGVPIVNAFRTQGRHKVLAEHGLFLFDRYDRGQLEVYKDTFNVFVSPKEPIEPSLTLEEEIDIYATFLAKGTSLPLGAVLDIRHSSRRKVPYVRELEREDQNRVLKKLRIHRSPSMDALFSSVPFLECTLSEGTDPSKIYGTIKEGLDQVINR